MGSERPTPTVLVNLLSAGWVVPLYMSATWYFGTLWSVVQFHANGGAGLPSMASASSSLPNEQFDMAVAGVAFAIACVWLTIVIMFWSGRLLRLISSSLPGPGVGADSAGSDRTSAST